MARRQQACRSLEPSTFSRISCRRRVERCMAFSRDSSFDVQFSGTINHIFCCGGPTSFCTVTAPSGVRFDYYGACFHVKVSFSANIWLALALHVKHRKKMHTRPASGTTRSCTLQQRCLGHDEASWKRQRPVALSLTVSSPFKGHRFHHMSKMC